MNPVCTSCLIDLHYTKSQSSDVSERPTVDKILDSPGIRTKGILIYIDRRLGRDNGTIVLIVKRSVVLTKENVLLTRTVF